MRGPQSTGSGARSKRVRSEKRPSQEGLASQAELHTDPEGPRILLADRTGCASSARTGVLDAIHHFQIVAVQIVVNAEVELVDMIEAAVVRVARGEIRRRLVETDGFVAVRVEPGI